MFRYHVFAPYPHLIQHCTVLQFFSPLPSGSHWGIGSHWLLLLSITGSKEGAGPCCALCVLCALGVSIAACYRGTHQEGGGRNTDGGLRGGSGLVCAKPLHILCKYNLYFKCFLFCELLKYPFTTNRGAY